MNTSTRRARICLAALAACALSVGCSSVTTIEPLTDTPSLEDREKFEGTWLVGDSAALVRYTDDGVAHVAAVEWKEDDFVLGRAEFVVAAGENARFMSVRLQKDGDWQEERLFWRYRFTDAGDLVIWNAKADAFRQLVSDGQLQGTVTTSKYAKSVVLTGAADDIMKQIDSEEGAGLFDLLKPVIVRKISSPR